MTTTVVSDFEREIYMVRGKLGIALIAFQECVKEGSTETRDALEGISLTESCLLALRVIESVNNETIRDAFNEIIEASKDLHEMALIARKVA